MKKQSENQPIDDLFARKLGNMSLPPSADGFARLQARMGQGKQETKVVFWRNPEMQRYMTVAACLLLVCLVGWLYWPSGGKITINGPQVATNQTGKSPSTAKKTDQKTSSQPAKEPTRNEIDRTVPTQEESTEQLAKATKSSEIGKQTNHLANSSGVDRKITSKGSLPVEHNEPVVAQVTPVNTKAKPDEAKTTVVPIATQPAIEQLAENKPITKPAPVAERVLVVTIAEPESLVAARQAAKTAVEEQSVVASTDKPEKETKMGGLWQQVKRIKQGDVFARRDNSSDDERGLLDRAYSGLKRSLDKDKSAKQ